MASKRPDAPEQLLAPRDEEGSVIRARDGEAASASVRPPQESSSSLKAHASAPRRTQSSTRPAAPGSLADRLERKMQLAMVLGRNLPPSDVRVRLLHIAIMRRDESLLDGVLAELNKPA